MMLTKYGRNITAAATKTVNMMINAPRENNIVSDKSVSVTVQSVKSKNATIKNGKNFAIIDLAL